MKTEMEQAADWVREAGALVLQVYGTEFEVRSKGREGPVTEADRRANDLIVARIREAYPADAVLAEESPDDPARLGNRRVWHVDPLDGTREFVGRTGDFAVLVGLAVAGRAAMGVSFEPLSGRLLLAARGHPTMVEREGRRHPARVSRTPPGGPIHLAASRSRLGPRTSRLIERLGVQEVSRVGSVGLKAGLVATGGCDAYVHPGWGTRSWDSCAAEVLVEQAGGRFTDTEGRPLRYDRRDTRNLSGLVASNGRLHEVILAALVAESRRE